MMNSPASNSEPSQGFGRLARPVQRWIWNQGWKTLHEIQERAIHTLLDSDRDVIIAAATARGKTEAAFFPLISSVLEQSSHSGFDLVYLSPLKALINDQFGRLQDLCRKTGLPVYPWHGDISLSTKKRAREKPDGILLITPESLEALFVRRGLDAARLFQGVQAVVVDELHAFLDNERGIHVRSLLTRMELSVGHRIRRVGLSATLSEMKLVRKILRPENPERVEIVEDTSSNFWLKAQIRGYLRQESLSEKDQRDDMAARTAVAQHLFRKLRGTRNLIFAGSRQNVESYADTLRVLSEKEHLPLEFFPHHANLSQEHRMDLEERLRTHPATTAVCTSTLELGIDIGEIACVAQIGPPFSVSSLRQRLGRSGRRAGAAAVLRMYQIELQASTKSHPLDGLYLGLIRSIAMIELLRQRWCEPPLPQALHLSTLTHQILSVIAEHGGRSAARIYQTLCERGPFQSVTRTLFAHLLRQLGSSEVALIEQAPDGTLLLGPKGERLVEHYSFYAVFQTPKEYRIITENKELGTLPITMVVVPDMTIIFSGRRWRILEVRDKEKVIRVSEDRVGTPPNFPGAGGLIHDRVVAEMQKVLTTAGIPDYLNETAAELLEHARSHLQTLGLPSNSLQEIGKHHALIATWTGTVKTSTLALMLTSRGYKVTAFDGFLDVEWNRTLPPVTIALAEIAGMDSISPESAISENSNLGTEKFHPYLSTGLLIEDVASSRLDFGTLPALARRLIHSDGS